MDIGQQLLFYRHKKGLTQKEVADAINIDKSTYCHYERGNRVPSTKMWMKLSNVLGFPVFPAYIEVDYPDDLLERLENCINENGKPSPNPTQNNEQIYRINKLLDETYKIEEEAINFEELPIEKIDNYTSKTILKVTLDIRAEKLRQKAIKCIQDLLAAMQTQKYQ